MLTSEHSHNVCFGPEGDTDLTQVPWGSFYFQSHRLNINKLFAGGITQPVPTPGHSRDHDSNILMSDMIRDFLLENGTWIKSNSDTFSAVIYNHNNVYKWRNSVVRTDRTLFYPKIVFKLCKTETNSVCRKCRSILLLTKHWSLL